MLQDAQALTLELGESGTQLQRNLRTLALSLGRGAAAGTNRVAFAIVFGAPSAPDGVLLLDA